MAPITLLLLGTLILNAVADRPPPVYRIQLDELPERRWEKVMDDHQDLFPLVREEANRFIPPFLQKVVFGVAAKLRHFFPVDYARELEGISRYSGLPLGEIVGLNILYDISAFDRSHPLHQGCTSLVACDSKGRIWHGRNLDYEMGDLLKNMTIMAEFYRGDELIYTGTTFVMYTGLLTGQRPGAFSLSLNERYSGSYLDTILMEIITHFKNPVSFVMRQTLEEESSFEGAVARLSKVKLICPAYIIVAGVQPFEGALISRDRWSAADVERLDADRWFFVETNFDHWKPDGDKRKSIAISMLEKLGRSRVNAITIMNILSTSPVKNELTLHSGVMSAANPEVMYRTTIIRTDAEQDRRYKMKKTNQVPF